MSDKMKQEMSRIQIPSNLHQRAIRGVKKAKSEMRNNKNFLFTILPIAASMIIISSFGYNYFNQQNGYNKLEVATNIDRTGLKIPAIELPESGGAKMMPLIVYKGKIYTQSSTKFDSNNITNLVGEKLGKTKSGLDEWSKQDEYAVEFASSIGETDVYSVKGYSIDFRIMTYQEVNGETFAEFYECVNGLTVYEGKDVLGHLKLEGNIKEVKARSYDDSINNANNFKEVENKALFNPFIKELNKSEPYLLQDVEAKLGDFRNNEQYKELTIYLNDGTIVPLGVIKGGYIVYGQSLIFKLDDKEFKKLWNLLNT